MRRHNRGSAGARLPGPESAAPLDSIGGRPAVLIGFKNLTDESRRSVLYRFDVSADYSSLMIFARDDTYGCLLDHGLLCCRIDRAVVGR